MKKMFLKILHFLHDMHLFYEMFSLMCYIVKHIFMMQNYMCFMFMKVQSIIIDIIFMIKYYVIPMYIDIFFNCVCKLPIYIYQLIKLMYNVVLYVYMWWFVNEHMVLGASTNDSDIKVYLQAMFHVFHMHTVPIKVYKTFIKQYSELADFMVYLYFNMKYIMALIICFIIIFRNKKK